MSVGQTTDCVNSSSLIWVTLLSVNTLLEIQIYVSAQDFLTVLLFHHSRAYPLQASYSETSEGR